MNAAPEYWQVVLDKVRAQEAAERALASADNRIEHARLSIVDAARALVEQTGQATINMWPPLTRVAAAVAHLNKLILEDE